MFDFSLSFFFFWSSLHILNASRPSIHPSGRPSVLFFVFRNPAAIVAHFMEKDLSNDASQVAAQLASAYQPTNCHGHHECKPDRFTGTTLTTELQGVILLLKCQQKFDCKRSDTEQQCETTRSRSSSTLTVHTFSLFKTRSFIVILARAKPASVRSGGERQA